MSSISEESNASSGASNRVGRHRRRYRTANRRAVPCLSPSAAYCLVMVALAVSPPTQLCHAREWTDIVNVQRIDRGDRYRWQKKLEMDPTLAEGETSAPVAAPTYASATEKPTIFSGAGTNGVTGAPTARATTAAPTIAPTVAPTDRTMSISANGGCSKGEFLMALLMYDGGSDGWDDAKLALLYNEFKIQHFAFKGGLEDGSSGIEYLCLQPDTCYTAIVEGKVWLNEISWEIRPVVLGRPGTYKWAVAKGRAPVQCQFSFGNQQTPACESTCLSWDPVEKEARSTGSASNTLQKGGDVINGGNAQRPTRRPTPRTRLGRPPTMPSVWTPTTKAPSPYPTLSDDFRER